MQGKSLLQKSKEAPDVIRSCFAITGVLITALHCIFRLLLFFLKITVPDEGARRPYELCFPLTAPLLET